MITKIVFFCSEHYKYIHPAYGGAYVAFIIDFSQRQTANLKNVLRIFIVPLIERMCTDCIKFLVSFFEKPNSYKLYSKRFSIVPRAPIIIGTNINV